MARKIDKDKEILAIMRDVECTREEAEEIFATEEKVRANGSDKVIASADKPKKATKREPKVDTDKVELINRLFEKYDFSDIENLKIANAQREITFTFKGFEYSLTLTKHRPPKS